MSTEIEAPFLIIGSASSGTTFLSNILDRHPTIACGPELSVFNKKESYDIAKIRNHLSEWFANGLSTDGQSYYPDYFHNLDAYFWTREEVIQLLHTESTIRSFYNAFFSHYLKARGKKMWGEKTGSNAYCISEFIRLYPRAKVIHLLRDGRDCVCSIMRRSGGVGTYHAVSHWTYNVAAGITHRGQKYYLEVKYEDLVRDPEYVIKKICTHLGVEFSEQMLRWDISKYWKDHAKGNIHDGAWRHSPFSAPSSESIGNWKRGLTSYAENMFWNCRLTKWGAIKLNCKAYRVSDLMSVAAYDEERIYPETKLARRAYVEAWGEWAKRFKQELASKGRVWLPITSLWGGG